MQIKKTIKYSVILIIILICIGILLTAFKLFNKNEMIYSQSQIINEDSGAESIIQKQNGLVYKEYDGEIVNVTDTATLAVTIPNTENYNNVIVVLVDCTTGKRIEKEYTEKLLFENVSYGTYAIAAYQFEMNEYTEIDLMVEIEYEVKAKSS